MESLRPAFKELRSKEEKLEKELKVIKNSIDSLSKICEHDYVYEGHDSHKNYEKCTICGDSISI